MNGPGSIRGLFRAEWLRFRKRRSLQIIVLAVPLLVAFFFITGFAAVGESPPPFDAEAVRARLIGEGVVNGLPPDQAEQVLASLIDGERLQVDQQRAQVDLRRASYVFPNSLVTALGNSGIVLVAMILLTATSIGDEFSWGTIRTALLASGNRRRLLLVRLATLGGLALLLVVLLLVVGAILPAVLVAAGASLPATPGFDPGALLALVVGELVVGLAVIGFAALATLLVRSGNLTLVVCLVYLALEAAILAVLLRFESFQPNGPTAWLLDVLPIHGLTTLTTHASQAATGLGGFPGDVINRDLGIVAVPILALTVWGVLFALLALRRFTRMDIVE